MVADPFALLRGGSGRPICLHSGYAELCILCGRPKDLDFCPSGAVPIP